MRYIVRFRGSHPYAGRYDGAGGSPQEDMQKAQVYGWAKRATERLDHYRSMPERYEVIPVEITTKKPWVDRSGESMAETLRRGRYV